MAVVQVGSDGDLNWETEEEEEATDGVEIGEISSTEFGN